MQKQPQRSKVSIDFEGKTYSANYTVRSGAVTVESDYGSRSTHVGGKAVHTARMLLREILQEAKARSELGRGD